MFCSAVIVLVIAASCHAGWTTGQKSLTDFEWSYWGEMNGQNAWPALALDCGKSATAVGNKMVSPINFHLLGKDMAQQAAAVDLLGLMTNTKQNKAWIQNLDHAYTVTFESSAGAANPWQFKTPNPSPLVASKIGAAAAETTYKFDHMTFHHGWVDSDLYGSEHMNGPHKMPLEIQFHFYDGANADYKTAADAALTNTALDPAKLVSIAVLCEIGTTLSDSDKEITKLMTQRGHIINKKVPRVQTDKWQISTVTSSKQVDVTKFFPTDRAFYTYVGQQTKPPCRQVAWIVMEKYCTLRRATLNSVRLALLDKRPRHIQYNYRNLQEGVAADQLLTRYKGA